MTDELAVVVVAVVACPEQSHMWPAPHGQCPSGRASQVSAHFVSVAPYTALSGTALQVGLPGAVVLAALVDVGVGIGEGTVVGVGTGTGMGIGIGPLPDSTVISAQF